MDNSIFAAWLGHPPLEGSIVTIVFWGLGNQGPPGVCYLDASSCGAPLPALIGMHWARVV